VQTWTERLANLREDLTFRQDTAGDKFRVELDKQTLDNRGIAGELLLRRAEKIKTRFGETSGLDALPVLIYPSEAGFNNTAELILRGKKQLQHPHHRHGAGHHPLARISGAGI